MAAGDITFFNAGLEEARENWAGTDTIKLAILDNTATPPAAPATPARRRPRRAEPSPAPAASSPAPDRIARALAGVPSTAQAAPDSASPAPEADGSFARREMRRIEEMLLLELID